MSGERDDDPLARCTAWLIDAVGCLIEPREPPARVYVRIAAEHGIAAHEAQVARRLAPAMAALRPPVGSDLDALQLREREGWREVVRAALGEKAAAGPCFDALFEHYALGETWSVLPGAPEALDAARGRGVGLAVVSNMDARLLAVLDALELSARFDVQALPSTCGLAKPDPAVFRWALARLKCPASRALYIGDRGPDCVDAARAAGLHGLRLGSPSTAPGARDWREIRERWT